AARADGAAVEVARDAGECAARALNARQHLLDLLEPLAVTAFPELVAELRQLLLDAAGALAGGGRLEQELDAGLCLGDGHRHPRIAAYLDGLARRGGAGTGRHRVGARNDEGAARRDGPHEEGIALLVIFAAVAGWRIAQVPGDAVHPPLAAA